MALLSWLRDRFAPAFLMAAGITLLAGGIVSLGGEVADPNAREPIAIPTPGSPGWTIGGDGTGGSAVEGSAGTRVATRVAITALGIDLPVVLPPGGPDAYPLCDVAMYIQELGQPGEGRATYLYAHAREGMFLPLLEESRVATGEAMLGALVEVYTSDDRLYLYEITEVRPHQLSLRDAIAASTEQLWLQTSEGPRGTRPKLQVVASFLSSGPVDHASAHPVARPRVCE